ncbi:NAD-dependent epimerase/dehydratase family protein [Maribacter sp. MAR_2009_72]|uniref:NAD-dependent epimerase/dehydratase family protein n=1 Tax=Maribacter sp. MAR_2009_72 TaxID=1250050 RepID=UPI001199C5EC|nr:NAD-dependent epimerase/dehydratase family protein [Maribacter sp. MAR_2009_72]TVZ13857.1 UDP-glucuronate 4-epimerase [Maribacter sp. MAR_2009_72]
MKILITGAAGFIGFHLVKALFLSGHEVIGLDNLNNYYDVNLKLARLRELGIDNISDSQIGLKINGLHNFSFYKGDICDTPFIDNLFKTEHFTHVIHLAAQAGVRYSITNPDTYIDSNIIGFYNILKNAKQFAIEHFIYASSSSVYGNSKKMPFSTSDNVDQPISLYAATKKSNELFAYTYSHLFNLKTTGLRFFTVYGPWGRPDMAYYKFIEAIMADKKIPVYNNGNLERDFTYIDDIINGIIKVIDTGFISNSENENYAIYNIGNGNPIKLMDFISTIEHHLGRKAIMEMLSMQDGDVYKTYADISDLKFNYGYQPTTNLNEGIRNFVEWYKQQY